MTSASGLLAGRYDALLVDLDGVVYRGDEALPGAPEALRAVRRGGTPVQFLTNNSSRTPEQVAEKLTGMGVDASPDEVLTSSVATAAMLRREGWSGREAFVVGEVGVVRALEEAGIRPVNGIDGRADLVVVGWDRSFDYAKLRTAALLVQRGARLVATNDDPTYPAPDGLWPGAGSILAAITTATGADPVVVGKPARPLFEAAAERVGAANPLVVGDRLDTDVAGASAMGWDSLLVTTGAHGRPDLIGAPALPTYVARGLGALLEPSVRLMFRRAAARDAPEVKELLESSGLSSGGVEERLPATVVGEDEDGSVAATAAAEPLEASLLLRSVAVRADARGHEAGVLVVAAAVAQAPEHERIWLFTETAEPFFVRLGFQRVPRDAVPREIAESPQAREECAESGVAMVREQR